MLDLSIIIPCYNEADSLPRLFRACSQALQEEHGMEVVFVDNGSTDNSADVFEAFLSQNTAFLGRVVRVPVNRGYGYGIMQGVRSAVGRTIAWTHADLQTDPKDVVSALRRFEEQLRRGSIVVKGRRVGRKLFDALFTAGMSVVTSLMLLMVLNDINAQPKLFPRSLLSYLASAPDDFSLDVYLLFVARRHNLQICEYPVKMRPRVFGQAKGGGTLRGKLKLTSRTLKFLIKLRREISRGVR